MSCSTSLKESSERDLQQSFSHFCAKSGIFVTYFYVQLKSGGRTDLSTAMPLFCCLHWEDTSGQVGGVTSWRQPSTSAWAPLCASESSLSSLACSRSTTATFFLTYQIHQGFITFVLHSRKWKEKGKKKKNPKQKQPNKNKTTPTHFCYLCCPPFYSSLVREYSNFFPQGIKQRYHYL